MNLKHFLHFLLLLSIAVAGVLEIFEIGFCTGNISKFSFGYTEAGIFLYILYANEILLHLNYIFYGGEYTH